MRHVAKIVGGLLIISGAVWILQGFNVAFAPQSFMTGNTRWIANGTVTVLVGIGLVEYGFRSGR